MDNIFVSEIHEFKKLEKLVTDIFYTDRELPEQVFRKGFNNYMFEEFDWAMSDDFWSTIQNLAQHTKDDFIITTVLNPHPFDYYYKEFGYFNWAKIPINSTADDYFNILESGPSESPTDAMLFNSYTVAWFSPSMKWAIWGEREYGICVLAFKEFSKLSYSLPFLKTWRSIDDEAVMKWVGLNFREQKVPMEIANALHLNYSNNIE